MDGDDKKDPIVIGNTSVKKDRNFFRWIKNKNNRSKLYTYIFIGLIAAAILIYLGQQYIINRKFQEKTDNNQCNTNQMRDTIQKDSYKAILKKDVPALEQQVAKIKTIKNYERDPNCLYPIVEYYIIKGNADESRKYFTNFKAVYQPNIGLAPWFNQVGDPPDKLERIIVSLEKQKKDADNNAFYGPEVKQ